jgi:hypothetical protein
LKPVSENGDEILASGDDTGGSISATVWQTKMAAGPGESTYTFQLVWPKEENDYRYSVGVENIRVTLTAEQED